MFNSLEINGYRGLQHFEMKGLGRVNLLVGRNNSGKTSILEALQLLTAAGDPVALWRILNRRGERPLDDLSSQYRQHQPEFDVCHLFCGHELRSGSLFSIATLNESKCAIKYRLAEATQENMALFPSDGDEPIGTRLALHLEGVPAPSVTMIPLSRRGGIRAETIDLLNRIPQKQKANMSNTQYVATESLSVSELLSFWNTIVLTPAQDLVVYALQLLEPSLEQIAPTFPPLMGGIPFYLVNNVPRGGFLVKLKDVEKRIPIGTFGDGMWRMLALAIALSSAKDGLLLIDEIDTGLHYSAMSSMWKMINETSKKLNIQVFATTHSLDCVNSLASICRENVSEGSEVSVQRIESERGRAVAYTEAEIEIAAKRHIEMR